MLPDLKFLLCGVLFCVLLFVAAGGVTLPESPTHVGEMPEIARPMMQESIAWTPPPPVFAMVAVSSGAESREEAAIAAPAPDGPDGAADSGASLPLTSGPATSGAGYPGGDPLKDLLESLPGADRFPPVADAEVGAADPPTPARAVRSGIARVPLPPRRTAARGHRRVWRVFNIVQHHSLAVGGGAAR